MKQLLNKKIFAAISILGVLAAGGSTVASSFAATTAAKSARSAAAVRALGKAKFVLRGTVTAVGANSITLHVVNTSKNAKLFDGKDETITLGAATRISKKAKAIPLAGIAKGDTVKVFGIFDKKSGAITLARWIKVIPK